MNFTVSYNPLFLDKTFIPIDSTIYTNKKSKENILIKNLDIVNASLLDKIDGVIVEFPFDDKILEIRGYFKKDPLNVNKRYNFLTDELNHHYHGTPARRYYSIPFYKNYIIWMKK